MLPDKTNVLKRSYKSFSFAWNGLKTAFTTQPNFKIQAVIGLLAVLLALFFNFNFAEWIILLIIISMVLTAELLNTSIEFITDHLFPDYNIIAGKIKDISAAAVLITSVTATITGILLFLPKIL